MWDAGPAGAGGAPATPGAGSNEALQAARRSMWDQGAGGPRPVHPIISNAAQPMGAKPSSSPVLMGPQGPLTGNIKHGTVKSYSVVKGFGFILCEEVPQDIYFGRDSLQADLRTSDVAGTQVSFELYRAPDGKPQGRNLRPTGNAPPTAAQAAAAEGHPPAGSGAYVRPPSMLAAPPQGPFRPMGMGMGMMGQGGMAGGCWPGKGMGMPTMGMGGPMAMGMGCGGCFPGKGAINPAFLGKPGFPMPLGGPGGLHAGFPGRPGFPIIQTGMMPGGMRAPYMVRPGDPMGGGMMGGMMGGLRPGLVPGQMPFGMRPGMQMGDKKRDWSPHAGSRAIKASLLAGGTVPADAEKKREGDEASRSKSKSSKRSSSSSSSRSRKRKKKRRKKKRSRSTSSSSSSGGKKAKKQKKEKEGDEDGEKDEDGEDKAAEDPGIAKAKLEALEKLRSMQSVEPKEERSKQFRALLREWHPDKNPDKSEIATAVFQFLQKGKSLLNLK